MVFLMEKVCGFLEVLSTKGSSKMDSLTAKESSLILLPSKQFSKDSLRTVSKMEMEFSPFKMDSNFKENSPMD